MKAMKWISGESVARSAKGNPITSTALVILFYLMFSVVEATVERLLFGERFEHWLDPFFGAAFMAYAAYCVFCCAVFNSGGYQE